MKNAQLSKLWDRLHSSYWFIPTLMAAGAIALAFLMLTLDRTVEDQVTKLSWIYRGGPEGARALLSTVAGSMMTVTGTAFSITIVALQLAASNFGPRLLRNFMQDTGNQLVLGTFIATFIYCLLILRTVHGEDYNLFVPQLSSTVGILLAIISTGVLIYFIHHASTMIQASQVITNVAKDLAEVTDRQLPINPGPKSWNSLVSAPALPTNFASTAVAIGAKRNGYLQAIDDRKLMKIACQHHLLLQITVCPGQFLVVGDCLVQVYPGKRVDSQVQKQLHAAFILGKERTEQQDIELPINQLVEISLRALSPAINDPFTAIRCIDQLKAGLSRIAQRDFPSPYHYDDSQRLRMVLPTVTFEQLVDAAFNQIRQHAAANATVTIRLLEALTRIASQVHHDKDRMILRIHAAMIAQESQDRLSEERDRQKVKLQHLKVIEVLEANQQL